MAGQVRVITARFGGTCRTCSKPFAAGEQINYGGKGAVTHKDCTPVAAVRVGRRTEIYQGYSATGRRCEDAPCCGCCD